MFFLLSIPTKARKFELSQTRKGILALYKYENEGKSGRISLKIETSGFIGESANLPKPIWHSSFKRGGRVNRRVRHEARLFKSVQSGVIPLIFEASYKLIVSINHLIHRMLLVKHDHRVQHYNFKDNFMLTHPVRFFL